MKKIILFVLLIAMVISFSLLVNATETRKFREVKPLQCSAAMNIDPAVEQAKRQRYIIAKERKNEVFAKISALTGTLETDSTQAVDIQMYTSTTHWQADSFGDFVWTGACYNNGSASAVFARVDIDVYDNEYNLLGSDWTYIWGGNNVKLTDSDYYTNALGAGETGFFRIWTNIPFTEATNLDYKFSYYTY